MPLFWILSFAKIWHKNENVQGWKQLHFNFKWSKAPYFCILYSYYYILVYYILSVRLSKSIILTLIMQHTNIKSKLITFANLCSNKVCFKFLSFNHQLYVLLYKTKPHNDSILLRKVWLNIVKPAVSSIIIIPALCQWMPHRGKDLNKFHYFTWQLQLNFCILSNNLCGNHEDFWGETKWSQAGHSRHKMWLIAPAGL